MRLDPGLVCFPEAGQPRSTAVVRSYLQLAEISSLEASFRDVRVRGEGNKTGAIKERGFFFFSSLFRSI